MIRVLLAEDQGLMRTSLTTLLAMENDLQVTAVDNAEAALKLLRAGGIDVALLDIQLPGRSGLDVARAVREESLAVRCVIVTTFPRLGYVRRAMEDGAAGFLLKDRPVDDLVAAIRTVAAGGTVIDDKLAVAALQLPPNPLTAREREVLAAAGEHATINEIAGALHLSPSTARNYLSAAIQKLDAANRAEARRLAEHNGWL